MTDPAEQPLSRREARKQAKRQSKPANGPASSSRRAARRGPGRDVKRTPEIPSTNQPSGDVSTDPIASILTGTSGGLDPLNAADVRVPEKLIPATSGGAKETQRSTMNEFDALLRAPVARSSQEDANSAEKDEEPVKIPGVFSQRSVRPEVPTEYSGDVLENRPRRRSFLKTESKVSQDVLDALSEESLDFNGDIAVTDLNANVESFPEPVRRNSLRQTESVPPQEHPQEPIAHHESQTQESQAQESVVVEPVVEATQAAENNTAENDVQENIAEANTAKETVTESAAEPVDDSVEDLTPLQRAIASGLLTQDLVQAAIDEIQRETQSIPIITDSGEKQDEPVIGEPVMIESTFRTEVDQVTSTSDDIKTLEDDYIAAIMGFDEEEQFEDVTQTSETEQPVSAIVDKTSESSAEQVAEENEEDEVVDAEILEDDVESEEFVSDDNAVGLETVALELSEIPTPVVRDSEPSNPPEAVEFVAIETVTEPEIPALVEPEERGYYDPVEEALREVAAAQAAVNLDAQTETETVKENHAVQEHEILVGDDSTEVTEVEAQESKSETPVELVGNDDPAAVQSLILPGFDQDIRGPLNNTGEIILTGMIDLPQSFSETGSYTPLDAFEDEDTIDAEFDSIMNPMRASQAISATDLDEDHSFAPAKEKKSNKILVGSVLGVVGVAATGLLVYALIELL